MKVSVIFKVRDDDGASINALAASKVLEDFLDANGFSWTWFVPRWTDAELTRMSVAFRDLDAAMKACRLWALPKKAFG